MTDLGYVFSLYMVKNLMKYDSYNGLVKKAIACKCCDFVR